MTTRTLAGATALAFVIAVSLVAAAVPPAASVASSAAIAPIAASAQAPPPAPSVQAILVPEDASLEYLLALAGRLNASDNAQRLKLLTDQLAARLVRAA